MARIQWGFDRSLTESRDLAHHVHTQLSCCLAAVQRALGGAYPTEIKKQIKEVAKKGKRLRETNGECLAEDMGHSQP